MSLNKLYVVGIYSGKIDNLFFLKCSGFFYMKLKGFVSAEQRDKIEDAFGLIRGYMKY